MNYCTGDVVYLTDVNDLVYNLLNVPLLICDIEGKWVLVLNSTQMLYILEQDILYVE